MENIEKKTPLNDLMDTTMDKIRDMVDSNTIIGEPITTPDGVTVIPVSRVSFGFGAGGGDYGKTDTAHFGGGAGAGVKVDPVAFLVVKDGLTRVMPVAIPAAATVDRVLDLVPEVLDRVQNFVDKKREEKISTDFGHNRGIPNEGVIPCRVLPDAYLPFSLLFPA